MKEGKGKGRKGRGGTTGNTFDNESGNFLLQHVMEVYSSSRTTSWYMLPILQPPPSSYCSEAKKISYYSNDNNGPYIDHLYSPGGTSVHPYLIHGSLRSYKSASSKWHLNRFCCFCP